MKTLLAAALATAFAAACSGSGPATCTTYADCTNGQFCYENECRGSRRG